MFRFLAPAAVLANFAFLLSGAAGPKAAPVKKAPAAKKTTASKAPAASKAPTSAKKSSSTAKKAVSRYSTPTYADPTEGDQFDGEDLVVRRAAVDALGGLNGTVVVVDREPEAGAEAGILPVLNHQDHHLLRRLERRVG
jgi:hypothetical protein